MRKEKEHRKKEKGEKILITRLKGQNERSGEKQVIIFPHEELKVHFTIAFFEEIGRSSGTGVRIPPFT